MAKDKKMDITFNTSEGVFNYRVCAVILHAEKILAMHNERSPYFYLPGGRVNLKETAEHAVLREVREELNTNLKIARPLWINQAFLRKMLPNAVIMNCASIFLWIFQIQIFWIWASNSLYMKRNIHINLNGCRFKV